MAAASHSAWVIEHASWGPVLGAVAMLVACANDERFNLAAEASAAHLETFARLERWATRLEDSDLWLAGPKALSEATFAPFRSEPDVLWAEVRAAEQLMRYEEPVDSAELRYVTIDTPQAGRLWVALAEDCQRRSAPQRRGDAVPCACVVLARPEAEGPGSRLRVAFRRGSE